MSDNYDKLRKLIKANKMKKRGLAEAAELSSYRLLGCSPED